MHANDTNIRTIGIKIHECSDRGFGSFWNKFVYQHRFAKIEILWYTQKCQYEA